MAKSRGKTAKFSLSAGMTGTSLLNLPLTWMGTSLCCLSQIWLLAGEMLRNRELRGSVWQLLCAPPCRATRAHCQTSPVLWPLSLHSSASPFPPVGIWTCFKLQQQEEFLGTSRAAHQPQHQAPGSCIPGGGCWAQVLPSFLSCRVPGASWAWLGSRAVRRRILVSGNA